ncbi:MAG: hypothetical protein KJ718_06205 [Nanoarchaeota archaeon]|nr:hypothetical protein [Nanoarchaeota archaeon]MBU1052113.1 hypothetical protein [Nanoarchaeota archaeon]MBU1988322.1 hypothetical protein [Nanoarchaeota archaeon]
MIKTRKKVSSTCGEELHKQVIDRILKQKLYKNLSVFHEHSPQFRNAWRELRFTSLGILLDSYMSYTNYASPDIILLTENPGHLIIIEVKSRLTRASGEDMCRQLGEYHEYIAKHPKDLSEFLEKRGISLDEIADLTIGFSGVVGTRRRGVREVRYFELFEEN